MRLTPDQQKFRAKHLNASEFAAVLGLSPYQGDDRVWVWSQKTGLIESGPLDPDAEADQFWFGHMVEPLIAARFAEKSGLALVAGSSYEHPDHPWCAATVDRRVVSERANLEIKCVGAPMCYHWKPSQPEGIPHHVMIQVQVQMACTQMPRTYVAALLGGTQLGIWRIEAQADLQAHILSEGKIFWQSVIENRRPDITGSESTRKMLMAIYPREERPTLLATPELDAIALQRHYAAQREKHEAEQKACMDHTLMSACGDHRGIRGEGWSFSWHRDKTGKRVKRFNWTGAE